MTAKQIAKILKENGWKLKRIESSHRIYGKEGCRPVPIPFHGNGDLGWVKEYSSRQGLRIRRFYMVYNCNIEKDGSMFLVDFPDMPNIQTYGDTLEHALEMAKEALDGCLEVEILQGLPVRLPAFKGGYPVTVSSHIALTLQLRELRGEQSQSDIAKKLGLSYQSYQRLENPRKANPTIKTLEKIAHVYGRELSIAL